ncbi:MAG TPA: 4'-phosphopantetheinyl transferase superfamily protein [Hanamia sp.]|nr:4'-phosphopantetheinyl transferase superfamily protein [Hanamia sp.]
MPLFYQHNINDNTKLAVWYITENEHFFLEKVPLQTEVSHPHKRLQHLAARYLLEILQPGFPFHLIEIADSKKPLLSNEEFHFSVSHCGDYAAAIVSENKLVGIDVELITPRVERIKNKFLSENEMNLLPVCNTKFLTLCWSAKEAIYKWYGKGQVDFKSNMIIDRLLFEKQEGKINAHFEKDERTDLVVEFRFFENLCLAWV